MVSQNCLKSLIDTLLEYAALNIDLLFPKQNSDKCAVSTCSNDVPIMPKNLFEEILEKSIDMCWSISKEHLMPCVKARHKLKWNGKSYFRFIHFSVKDRELYAESLHKHKTIKITIILSELSQINFFYEFSKLVDNLIDLDITIKTSQEFEKIVLLPPGTDSNVIMDKIGTLMHLHLKRLRLNMCKLELFPYLLEIDKLTELELHKCWLTKSFLKKLVCFNQLVHLSFDGSRIDDCHMEIVVDAVVSLKALRFLNLCIYFQSVDVLMMNKIMTELENLDILELRNILTKELNQLITPKRKLKVLNYRYLSAYDLTGLAVRIGNYENLDGLMTIITTTPSLDFYLEAINTLVSFIKNEGVDLDVLREAERKGIFNFRSPLRLAEICQSGPCSNTFYDVILRIICCAKKNPVTKEWMMNFIEHNENTHLANKFKSLL